jgi:hypothetical protein
LTPTTFQFYYITSEINLCGKFLEQTLSIWGKRPRALCQADRYLTFLPGKRRVKATIEPETGPSHCLFLIPRVSRPYAAAITKTNCVSPIAVVVSFSPLLLFGAKICRSKAPKLTSRVKTNVEKGSGAPPSPRVIYWKSDENVSVSPRYGIQGKSR